MPDLRFSVEGIHPVPNAAVPTLGIRLRVTNALPDDDVQHVALQTQIQIEPGFRTYTAEEQERLRDLFDDPSRWAETLRTMPWTHLSAIVPRFGASTVVELPVPCSFDFNIAATKYFAGVRGGEIPLRLLFSGTVFYRPPGAELQVAPIPWTQEADCRLAADMWQRLMDLYYPNEAWLTLRRDVFDRLLAWKVRGGFPTWESAVAAVLDAQEAKP